MGLFDRLRGRGPGGGGRRHGTLDRGSHRGDLSHLEQFVASRRGVEGYVEPRTTVTETTIVLVAADGEWTRRRIDGPEVARRLSRELAIPVYDAQVTGYPQRMRDWSARKKETMTLASSDDTAADGRPRLALGRCVVPARSLRAHSETWCLPEALVSRR